MEEFEVEVPKSRCWGKYNPHCNGGQVKIHTNMKSGQEQIHTLTGGKYKSTVTGDKYKSTVTGDKYKAIL